MAEKPANKFEAFMRNVADVDAAIAALREKLKDEKDVKKQMELRQEENKLKQLWSKLVMAARKSKDAKE
jgi:hypothetical protein